MRLAVPNMRARTEAASSTWHRPTVWWHRQASQPCSGQARPGGFDQAAALETATTGVTVNAICPGWVLTPLVQKQIDARAEKMASPKTKPAWACWVKAALAAVRHASSVG